VLTGVAMIAAVWLRAAPLFAEFAFGDGGLFWVMANALRENGLLPPSVVDYNRELIPWVYPPLGLYLVALLGGSLDLFRVLPALFAIASLPAMWLLARSLVGERAALVALIAYGLTLPAYFGLIAGGGVTRAPGVLLALLTMWAVVNGRVAAAGMLGGATLLAHPIAAVYALLSCTVLWAARGAPRRMLLAVPVALAVAGIWFAPMIAHHGLDPFLGGATSRDFDLIHNFVVLLASVLNPPNLAFTIGLLGLGVAVVRRRWDLLGWVGVTFLGLAVLDRWLVIPFSILAGIAVEWALDHPARQSSVALVAIATITAVTGVVLAGPNDIRSFEERAVMEWARSQTDPGATFAVIGYSADLGMVEWFPALTQRENFTTWQGTEWIRGGLRVREAKSAAGCQSVACLPPADYYVLRPNCCPEIESALKEVGPHVFGRP
jgi:hypothetical protein